MKVTLLVNLKMENGDIATAGTVFVDPIPSNIQSIMHHIAICSVEGTPAIEEPVIEEPPAPKLVKRTKKE